MSYVWQYISEEEYYCHHCGECPPSFKSYDIEWIFEDIFTAFQRLRETWGKPIPITSGYRCPEHNVAVGGERLSAHQFGVALDCLFADGNEVEQAYDILMGINSDLRIGKYLDRHFIHMDNAYKIFPKASKNWLRGVHWIK